MTPEQQASREIDRQLVLCGWIIQDRRDMNISAGPGVAIREFPLVVGEADYLLYVDSKAAGTIEAKPDDWTLSGVEPQSVKYVNAVPPGVPSHRLPLPFCYESTGKVTKFTNLIDPDARSREVFTFHQPVYPESNWRKLATWVAEQFETANRAIGDRRSKAP
jgi:type I restriction enzyme R subunit